ncbi:glycolate oxidase subunit GlcD [bacterium BMS3Abin04]|nr:glycolate oxidase subunit GlcD [bacterium BMS3Abin04]
MLTEKYLQLYTSLKKIFSSDRLVYDKLRTLAFGTDAGFYRLIPKLVVKVKNESEVVHLLKECKSLNIPVTFRTSGTSLSGQAITDSVLIKVDNSWKNYKVNEDGSQITLAPAVLGKIANLYLSPFNKKLGPDPASINAARISGIVANNASGMTSGTLHNSYNTLAGMRIVFEDGTILDVQDNKSKEEFKQNKKEFYEELLSVSKSVKENTGLSERIRKKYSIKNTTGYGINSLIDFDDPFEIIQHLMVGSEGTLGFISEITFNTVPNLPHKASALIIFKSIKAACDAIPILKTLPVDASEIMDRVSLRSVENKPGMPDYLKELSEDATALLIETSAESYDELQKKVDLITKSLQEFERERPIEFTDVKAEYLKLWNVRKGLFTSVSKGRMPGTTVIIEDINFDTSKLADAVLDLKRLFRQHNYKDTIIWGHALSGNIHFVFFHDFSIENEVKMYRDFIDDLTRLVIDKYDGSLKAEHGTGRNMAPFVKYEWGAEAYSVMQKIKKLFDPQNILNPGVLINDDTQIHIKNLKPTPIADPIIDKCIECGFCEDVCPSKELTLTPRQRIVVFREISKLHKEQTDILRLNELKSKFKYFGNSTCATDGLCELSCPVDIDTGRLIKKIRHQENTDTNVKIAALVSKNMNIVTTAGRVGLNFVHTFHNVLGDTAMEKVAASLRDISNNKIPLWNKYMPKGADLILNSTNTNSKLKVVYFPSCISRSMGVSKGSGETESQTTKLHSLLKKAGYDIIYPNNLANLCCGMPFSSKGFVKQREEKAKELEDELMRVSQNGEIPILSDTSPCTKTMKDFQKLKNGNELDIYDSTEFIYKFLMDKLTFHKLEETITIHPTCSTTKMDIVDKMKTIAAACVTNVIIPKEVTCCGFAGDRGFTFPELNKSALSSLKSELPHECHAGYSNSRTCEIGLSLHSGIQYKSIIYLVDKCTE